MTSILEHLRWESLKKWRRDSRLILLYKGLKGKASIPTDDLIPLVRCCRNDHSMAYQVPIANTDIYKCSFFPQTIRDWSALPDSLISSAEGAEGGINSSLLGWELGTSLPCHGPGEWLSFWRVTSNNSNSDSLWCVDNDKAGANNKPSSFWRPIHPRGPKQYPRTGRSSPLYVFSFTSCGQALTFRLRKPRVRLALVQMLLTCVLHRKSFVIVTPRYLILSTFWEDHSLQSIWSMDFLSISLLFASYCIWQVEISYRISNWKNSFQYMYMYVD